MTSHNTMSHTAAIIDQLQTAQSLLLRGCTAQEMADTLGCSLRQAQRVREFFTRRGHTVTREWKRGTANAAVFRMAKSERMFL